MRRQVVAFVLGAALLAACGESDVTARGAGSHCENPVDVHGVVTFPQLVDEPRWAEVAELDTAGGDAHVRRAELKVRERLRGEWPDKAEVRVTSEAADEARAERAAKSRLLVFGGRDEVLGLVALRPNGEAHFLGGCSDRTYRPALQAFRDRRVGQGDARTEAALLLDLVRNPRGEAAVALRELAAPAATRAPTPWASLAPDQRSLDGAPPEVIAALAERTLAISLPESWQETRVQICPRTSVGWNTCLLPQASRGTIELPVYVDRDAPLELWVTDTERGFRGRRVLALRIAPAALRAERVEVVGGDVGSTEEAFRAAEAGTALRLRS